MDIYHIEPLIFDYFPSYQARIKFNHKPLISYQKWIFLYLPYHFIHPRIPVLHIFRTTSYPILRPSISHCFSVNTHLASTPNNPLPNTLTKSQLNKPRKNHQILSFNNQLLPHQLPSIIFESPRRISIVKK